MGHSRPLFSLFSCFQCSKPIYVRYKSLPMTGAEPWTSGVGRDCSTNWATTTAKPFFVAEITFREPWSSGHGRRPKLKRFESRHQILDGHFFTLICCTNCLFEKTENIRKMARYGPFFNKTTFQYSGIYFLAIFGIKICPTGQKLPK